MTTETEEPTIEETPIADGPDVAAAGGEAPSPAKERFAKAMAELKASGASVSTDTLEAFDPDAKTEAPPAETPKPDAAPAKIEISEELVEEIARATTPKEEAKAQAVDSLADRYMDSPYDALLEAVKTWTGITDEKELADELKELIADAGSRIHGVDMDQSYAAKLMAKRAMRNAKQAQRSVAKDRESLEERSRQLATREEERRAVGVLDQAIAAQKEAFPWLASEEGACGRWRPCG